MSQSRYWDNFMRGRLSRRKVLKGGVLAGVGLLGVSTIGCEGSQAKPAGTTSTTSSTTSATTKPVGKAVWLGGSPKGEYNDPHRFEHSLTTWQMWTDDLVMPDDKGTTDRGLATSWSVAPDGLSWTFKLRKGVLFHDGTEFTAEDVKFSWERQLKYTKNPGTVIWAGFFDHGEVIDPYTVKAVLKKPEMAFLVHNQIRARILSKKYIEKVGDDYALEHPVGTGPWKVTKWTPGESMEFEANEQHYARVPRIKTIESMSIVDVSTRMAMLEASQADIVPGMPLDYVDQVKAMRGVQVLSRPDDYIIEGRFAYAPTGGGKMWYDERVRKAFMYAFNREKVAKELFRGLASPANNHLVPLGFGYNPDIKPWPFDPAKAKQLMAEAGFPNGADVSINISPSYTAEADAIVMVHKEVGLFRCKSVIEEGVRWLARINQRITDDNTAGIWWRTSPGGYAWAGDGGYLAMTFDYSKAAWTFPTGDAKMDQMLEAQQAITDVEKRKKALQEYHAYRQEKQFYVTGFNMPFLGAIGPRMKSWNPNGQWQTNLYTAELKS